MDKIKLLSNKLASFQDIAEIAVGAVGAGLLMDQYHQHKGKPLIQKIKEQDLAIKDLNDKINLLQMAKESSFSPALFKRFLVHAGIITAGDALGELALEEALHEEPKNLTMPKISNFALAKANFLRNKNRAEAKKNLNLR